MHTHFLTTLLIVGSSLIQINAADWPMWRGIQGDGTTPESELPTKWSAADNITWKTPLPGPGNSTPIVWQDRVFITQAIEEQSQRLLQCYDRSTGKLLWQEGVKNAPLELTHKTNPPCAGSPATDGQNVIVWFGSSGLHCYDFAGKKRWSLDLGEQRHIWGYGASPVIHGDLCYLNFGPGERQFLVCVNKNTGKIIWQHDEPGGDAGEGATKKWLGSWSDPIVRSVAGRDELFMTFSNRICAFDPIKGEELWTCGGLNALVYTSPLFSDGIVIGMGGYNGMAAAVKAGGSGDVTQSHRLWQATKTRQRIGSGVIQDGHIYILTDPGIAECRSLETGALVWEERLSGPGPTGQNWSSLVLSADGLCYAVNQGGDAFVFHAKPHFELVATNPMGEKIIGSIAAADGQLFIRGHQNLWCIGKRR